MDQAKILETICDLFLMSKLLWKDLCDIIKGDIEKGQYEKVAKLFIYRIILEMNTKSIYDRIIKDPEIRNKIIEYIKKNESRTN